MATQPRTGHTRPAGAPAPTTPTASSRADADPGRAVRGCRIDYHHAPARSALERFCVGQIQAAHRQARAADARQRLMDLLTGAVMPVLTRLTAPSDATTTAPATTAGAGEAHPSEPVDPSWSGLPGEGLDALGTDEPSQSDDRDSAGWDALQAAMDAELRVIEVIEAAKAALDAQALTALARMTSLAESIVAAAPAEAKAVPFAPGELVAMEVATATGLSQREVGIRAELATGAAGRYGRLRALLATGQVSLRYATAVVTETRHLAEDASVDDIVQVVFAPTRDGAGLTAPLFRSRLRRAVLRADTDTAARRRAARARNGVSAQVFDDGTGQLVVRNDAEKIAAAIERADTAARAAKAAGDPRSLEQLRADFITGAISYGQPCPDPHHHGHHGKDGHGDDGHGCDRSAQDAGTTADAGDPAPAGEDTTSSGAPRGTAPHDTSGAPDVVPVPCPVIPHWYASFGRRPEAKVWIVVPVTTALGLDDAPCELPGHGWVAAEQARAIITAPGSTWQTLLANQHTGHAIGITTRSYRPTPTMIAHVTAVDGTCRGPGCQVPAARCDLDHDIPHPTGPTTVSNLSDKHRQHHRVVTAAFWHAARNPNDASITWTTSAGRRYITYPTDWLDTARPRRARRDWIDYNPEPPTRPYGPEPDPNAHPDPGPPPF